MIPMVSILAGRLSIADMLVLVPTITPAQESVDKYVKAGEDQYSAAIRGRSVMLGK
jgi:hypothetical protein